MRKIGILTLLVCTALYALPGWSGSDHDQARQALEAGKIMPLRTLLRQVEKDYPGTLIEVELEQDDQRWIYELKLLSPGGGIVKLKLDARDGTLLKMKSKSPNKP